MFKYLTKKFDIYWICLILTVILCYTFFVTNSSVSIDDEYLNYTNSTELYIRHGKIFGFLKGILLGYSYIPYFYELLDIIIYCTAITIMSNCFIRYIKDFTKIHAAIFACLTISFPFYIINLLCEIEAVNNGFSVLIAAIALFLYCKYLYEDKKKLYLFSCIFTLTIGCSLAAVTSLNYFLICALFILYKNNNKLLKSLLNLFSISACSFIINYLLVFIISLIPAFKPVTHWANTLPSLFSIKLLNESIKIFINRFIDTLNYDFGSQILLISIILFLLISILKAIIKLNIRYIIICILMIGIPFVILILLKDGYITYDILSSVELIVAITFVLVYDLLKNKTILAKITFIIISLIVINNAREINKIAYYENLKYKNDLIVTNYIMTDLKRINLLSKPIVFAGLIKDINIGEWNYSIESPIITASILNWEKLDSFENELLVDRTFQLAKMLNYNIKRLEFDKIQNNINYIKSIVHTMPYYPNAGYIRNMGDYVIVKIGPSAADSDVNNTNNIDDINNNNINNLDNINVEQEETNANPDDTDGTVIENSLNDEGNEVLFGGNIEDGELIQ